MTAYRKLALALLAALTAQASTLVTARLDVDPNISGGSGPDDQTVTGVVGPLSLIGSATGGSGSNGDGIAFSNFGVIRLFGEFLISGQTFAEGIYQDDVTITAPGIATGTNGTLQFAVAVFGSFTAPDGFSSATWSLKAGLGDFGVSEMAFTYSPDTGNPSSGPGFGVFTGMAAFQYGVTTQLEVDVNAAAVAGNSFSSTGRANFDMAHSSYWGGISDVTADNAPVSSFDIASTSGTNWALSQIPTAPEPSTWMLALGSLALGSLSFLRRRWRK